MKSRGSAGYTIIEVLIVLAITGALFISAAAMLNGKQASTEAIQSIRDFESKIQNVVSEVSSGYFPAGLNCTAPLGLPPTIGPPGANGGSNEGCMFLGKVMSFDATSSDIISVLGRQYVGNIGSADVSNLAQARPRAIQTTLPYTYKYGLRVVKVIKVSDNSQISAVGFLSELGGGVDAASPVTGSRSILLYSLPGNIATTTATDISSVLSNSFSLLPDGARVCLRAANNKYSEILIGSSTNQTSTFVNIDVGPAHVCAT